MSDPSSALLGLPIGLAENDRVYLRPVALISGLTAERALTAGQAWRLAGGTFAFTSLEVAWRKGGTIQRRVASRSDFEWWKLSLNDPWPERLDRRIELLTARRMAPEGGLLRRPLIMGVLNVTPDSFSDGGRFLELDAALEQARRLAEGGADILDIGGESARPGAEPVDPETEARRIEPVLRALGEAGAISKTVPLSLDTRHAAVMRRGLALGATIINDVTALTGDPESMAVAATSGASIVLMHKRGEPATMNESPVYEDAALDIFDFLEERVEACLAAGIPRERLIVDPGIGFGKRSRHNLAIMDSLSLYHGLGCPVLIGVSRKGLTGDLDRARPPSQRFPDSLAAGLHALGQGVQILRVHDVAETRQALEVWARLTGWIG